jgi:acetyl-CoA synthetase
MTYCNKSGVQNAECMVFNPPENIRQSSHCPSLDHYHAMYARSVEDPVGFWGEIAANFYWKVPPSPENFLEYNFDLSHGPIKISWMSGAVTNVCYNVLDRNVANGLGDKIAFYW